MVTKTSAANRANRFVLTKSHPAFSSIVFEKRHMTIPMMNVMKIAIARGTKVKTRETMLNAGSSK